MSTRLDHKALPDPPPLPLPAGDPPPELWSEEGLPPCAWRFMGARGTIKCWMMPCPCCCQGWVALVPDDTAEDGYNIGPIGCSAGCDESAVTWWHLWRLAELPVPEPDERGRRYAAGAVRRILTALPDTPTEAQLRRAAFDAGRWLEAGEVPAEPVARALLAAASRAGFEAPTIAPQLAAAVTAGRARPGRIPA